MIISETRRFVFIHNPKCGGTTVRAALMPFETVNNFFWLMCERDGVQIDKAHMPMHVFRRLFPDYFSLLATSFVFMLVRDPYERAVSAFNETHKALLAATLEEEEQEAKRRKYIAALNGFITKMIPVNLGGWQFNYRHFVRQRDMAYLGPKKMVDCVVKLDDLTRSSRQLDVFDAALRPALLAAPEKNARVGSMAAREVLSEASVKKINELYRDDFYLFEYDMW